MNALAILTSRPAATMTSREIADLTGKEHRNVMRDIRTMLVELHGEDRLLSFEQTVERPNPSGGAAINSIVFVLPKREALVLVSGYSVELRAKIVDRWQDLEAGAAPALNLRQPGQMLAVAMQLAEICQEQQAQLVAQAPKVAFAEAVGEAENLQKIGELCSGGARPGVARRNMG